MTRQLQMTVGPNSFHPRSPLGCCMAGLFNSGVWAIECLYFRGLLPNPWGWLTEPPGGRSNTGSEPPQITTHIGPTSATHRETYQYPTSNRCLAAQRLLIDPASFSDVNPMCFSDIGPTS